MKAVWEEEVQPSWIGQKLNGRYEIQELLGEGGMASVYKAYDPNLRRVVALKLIHPHLSREEQFARRFESEAAAVAQLRHPNIIQVFDFAHDQGVYYIVFEFLPGETLQQHINRLSDDGRQMSYAEIVKAGSQLADALHYAHERGLVHRDVKPANIMLNFSGDAVLMDFGIVKMTGGVQHTATGAVVGTARYMAPEQIMGESADNRTDIYALGITLFQMVAGRVPYLSDSNMTIMMMQVKDPVPDIYELRANVPPDLVQVIKRSMEKNREDRYQSAAELASALQQANLDPAAPPVATPVEAPVRDMTATVMGRAPASSAPESPTPTSSSGGGLSVMGRRIPLFAVGLTGFVLLAALIFALSTVLDGGVERDATAGTIENMPEQVAATLDEDVLEPELRAVAAGAEVTQTPAAEEAVDTPAPTASATERPLATATEDEPLAAVPVMSEENVTPTATATRPEPSPTPYLTRAQTTAPTATPTKVPPTPTSEPQGPRVAITDIALSGSTYLVYYTTVGYTEMLPGMHVHFFFDTVPPEQAGSPGSGPWYLWGGPRPFDGYTTADRPNGASQMCALVANADHSVIQNTGNCWNLPSSG